MTAAKVFAVTLDSVGYDRKPTKGEVRGWNGITRRMQGAGPVRVTGYELAKAITSGRTFCGGCYAPARKEWGAFQSMQIFALDFDNDAPMLGEDGNPLKDAAGHVMKRPLMPGEKGYLDPWDALDRARGKVGEPLILYPSFSFSQVPDKSQPPAKCKYRMVLDLPEPTTDEGEAARILKMLLGVFPEADPACSNLNRLLFGSHGPCWLRTERGPRRVS